MPKDFGPEWDGPPEENLTQTGQVTFNPESVVGAALITQVAVIFVVFVGALLLRRGEEPGYRLIDVPKSSTIFRYLLGLGLLTLIILCFSDAFSNIWRPFAGVPFFGIMTWKTALFATWLIDILSVGALVAFTGGSRRSPFLATLFVFPTIALFLHESGSHLIDYTGIATVLYSLFLFPWFDGSDNIRENTECVWWVTVCCFVLTTGLGFITRQ